MTNPRGHVCIIDDDDDIRETLRFLLEKKGYRVLVAADGAEALACLRQQADRCCLILLDLMMPGMNGWDFREQQSQDPALAAIPVIVLSGARDTVQHARDMQAAGFMQKPIDLGELMRAVEHFCRGATAEG